MQMGSDDAFSGLVVPLTTFEEPEAPQADKSAGETIGGPVGNNQAWSPEPCAEPRLSGARKPRTRTPGKGPKGPLGETLFDLRMVLDDVTKAIGEIEAIKAANQPKWREAELLVEPLARVGHAERTLREVGRRH